MKAILAMVIDAERGGKPGPINDATLYANSVQVEFNDSVGKEGYDMTHLRCVATKDDFDLHGWSRYRNPRAKVNDDKVEIICRLEGRLGKSGMHRLASLLAQADEWYEKRRAVARREGSKIQEAIKRTDR